MKNFDIVFIFCFPCFVESVGKSVSPNTRKNATAVNFIGFLCSRNNQYSSYIEAISRHTSLLLRYAKYLRTLQQSLFDGGYFSFIYNQWQNIMGILKNVFKIPLFSYPMWKSHNIAWHNFWVLFLSIVRRGKGGRITQNCPSF